MVWSTTQSHSYEKSSPVKQRAEKRSAPITPILSRLLSDRDSLLMIGLIIILISERADKKLIMALAFALLT